MEIDYYLYECKPRDHLLSLYLYLHLCSDYTFTDICKARTIRNNNLRLDKILFIFQVFRENLSLILEKIAT